MAVRKKRTTKKTARRRSPAKVRRKVIAVPIYGGRDRNGNSRRGFIVYDMNGDRLDFIEDLYTGSKHLRMYYTNPVILDELDVLPSHYRWRKSTSKKR